jgi:hypothetical protein
MPPLHATPVEARREPIAARAQPQQAVGAKPEMRPAVNVKAVKPRQEVSAKPERLRLATARQADRRCKQPLIVFGESVPEGLF